MFRKLFIRKDSNGYEYLKIVPIVGYSIALLSFIWLLLFATYVVPAGHRGIAIKFGDVNMIPYREGIHFLVPFIQATSIEKMDVRVQVIKSKAAAGSKDLQNVHSTIALNYHVNPDKTPWVFKNLGIYYWDTIINPQIQEVFKATTAHYNATELITQRERVRSEAKEAITKRLANYNIIVDDFAIVDFQFDREFASAIEAKQIAEIRIQTERNNLESIKVQAEQKITSAKAEAEAMRVRQANVTSELTKWEAVKKWDGKLPNVTGGAIPYIDVTPKN